MLNLLRWFQDESIFDWILCNNPGLNSEPSLTSLAMSSVTGIAEG